MKYQPKLLVIVEKYFILEFTFIRSESRKSFSKDPVEFYLHFNKIVKYFTKDELLQILNKLPLKLTKVDNTSQQQYPHASFEYYCYSNKKRKTTPLEYLKLFILSNEILPNIVDNQVIQSFINNNQKLFSPIVKFTVNRNEFISNLFSKFGKPVCENENENEELEPDPNYSDFQLMFPMIIKHSPDYIKNIIIPAYEKYFTGPSLPEQSIEELKNIWAYIGGDNIDISDSQDIKERKEKIKQILQSAMLSYVRIWFFNINLSLESLVRVWNNLVYINTSQSKAYQIEFFDILINRNISVNDSIDFFLKVFNLTSFKSNNNSNRYEIKAILKFYEYIISSHLKTSPTKTDNYSLTPYFRSCCEHCEEINNFLANPLIIIQDPNKRRHLLRDLKIGESSDIISYKTKIKNNITSGGYIISKRIDTIERKHLENYKKNVGKIKSLYDFTKSFPIFNNTKVIEYLKKQLIKLN
ncbi:hypothetical protein ACTFIW_008605 [Dictyostelium discoideum]